MTETQPPFWERIARSPSGYFVALVVITTIGLGWDSLLQLRGQLVLSACVVAIFAFMMQYITREQRITTYLVVAVATWSEILGSIIWGAYTYRLGNLPLFVPPGHGLVFLAGLRLSQTRMAVQHRRAFLLGTAVFVSCWGALGLTGLLGRIDAMGAIGVVVLLIAMRYGPNPTLYAGVFWFVAFLEIYGTSVGTWRWAEIVPYTGIPDGNPPSGVAAGYVGFDLAAIWAMPKVMRWLDNRQARRAPSTDINAGVVAEHSPTP